MGCLGGAGGLFPGPISASSCAPAPPLPSAGVTVSRDFLRGDRSPRRHSHSFLDPRLSRLRGAGQGLDSQLRTLRGPAPRACLQGSLPFFPRTRRGGGRARGGAAPRVNSLCVGWGGGGCLGANLPPWPSLLTGSGIGTSDAFSFSRLKWQMLCVQVKMRALMPDWGPGRGTGALPSTCLQ